MITIEDVANFAGVSQSTVSRVLNKKEYVKEATREKVLKAVEELGYKPSRLARGLRINSSQILGLIISDIQNPFFTSLVRAVEDVANQNGYSLILCNTDENPKKEELYIELMISERVSGVIITPTREFGCPIQKLLNANIATICVDRRVLDCPTDSVISDNVFSSYTLIKHLITNGHTRIGALFGSSEITSFRERLEGYKKAISEFNLVIDSKLIMQGDPKKEQGILLTERLLNLENPPTAIVAGNNLMALGSIYASVKAGYSIPEDISIISFDNQEWMGLINPRLTVASQPTYEMGKLAAELALARIAKPNRLVKNIVLESEIIFRDSVKSLKTS